MKKLSQINEGMWSKTFDRARTGEVRTEEKIDSNVYTLKEVDLGLPFVFADEDLVIDGKNMHHYKNIKEILPLIKSTGWRLPTYDELKNTNVHNVFKNEIKYETKHDGKNGFRTISGTSTKTEETLSFDDISPTYGEYFILDDEYDTSKSLHLNVWYIGDLDKEDDLFNNFTIASIRMIYKVRLIKDKK